MPYQDAPDGWWRSFVGSVPAPTAKVAVTRADGSDDVTQVRHWAEIIGGRYMGADRTEEFGRRDGVPGELLVPVHVTRVVAKTAVAD